MEPKAPSRREGLVWRPLNASLQRGPPPARSGGSGRNARLKREGGIPSKGSAGVLSMAAVLSAPLRACAL